MPDAIYSVPRLAAVYDAFDGDRPDLDFYLGVADEFEAQSVVDVGCGTGCLALLLAARGRRVVGVDPAGASLDVARGKPGAAGVTWIHGDATALPPVGADLATMTANVAMVFLGDDEWLETLRAIAGALRDGGRFVFETRRPERRAWEDWAVDDTVKAVDMPGVGRVETWMDVTAVELPFVSFRSTHRFASDGAELTSESTLRFRSRDEVEASLAACGFRVLDVRDAPDRPGREFMFVTERSGLSGRGFRPSRPGAR